MDVSALEQHLAALEEKEKEKQPDTVPNDSGNAEELEENKEAIDAPEPEQPEPEQEVEEEPEDEPEAEEELEADAPKDKTAWAKQRKEKKELREELEALKLQMQSLSTNTPQQTAEQVTEQALEDDDPEPSPDDEVEHLNWKVRQLGKVVEKQQQVQQRQQVQQQAQQLSQAWEQRKAKMREENPMYGGAYDFLRDAFRAELRQARPLYTEQQLDAELLKIERTAAFEEMMAGRDPAPRFLSYAIAQGYDVTKAAATKAVQQPKVDKSELEHAKQHTSGTLGRGGTKHDAKKVSAEQFARMSLAEKDEAMKKGLV